MKRGERAPWKVDYRWEDTGVKGRLACSSEGEANGKADTIREAGENLDRPVTVTVHYLSPYLPTAARPQSNAEAR